MGNLLTVDPVHVADRLNSLGNVAETWSEVTV